MSNIIRRYKSIENRSFLEIKAIVGKNWAKDVCFTIEEEGKWIYVRLSEKQVKDLIKVLEKRLKCEKGYNATDTNEKFDLGNAYVNKDGKVIE